MPGLFEDVVLLGGGIMIGDEMAKNNQRKQRRQRRVRKPVARPKTAKPKKVAAKTKKPKARRRRIANEDSMFPMR